MKKILSMLVCLVMVATFVTSPLKASASTATAGQNEQLIQLLMQMITILQAQLQVLIQQSTHTTPTVQETTPVVVTETASFKNSSLTSDSENPTIRGTATGFTTVGFSIDNGGKVYGSGQFSVIDGKWSHKVSTDLQPGTYGIRLYDSASNELDRETLTILEEDETEGSINDLGLKTYLENPIITGTAIGVSTVGFSVNQGDKVYGSGQFSVIDGVWSHKIRTDLDPGTFEIVLYDDENNQLDSATLTVRWYPKIYSFILEDFDGVEGHEGTFIWSTANTDTCGIYRAMANGGLETVKYPVASSDKIRIPVISPEDQSPDFVLMCTGEKTSDGKDAPSIQKIFSIAGFKG